MKWHPLTLAVVAVAMLMTGCYTPEGTPDNTGTGALMGGAIGAISGAAIGGPRHGGEGALIGAAAGVIAGGLMFVNCSSARIAPQLNTTSKKTIRRKICGHPLKLAGKMPTVFAIRSSVTETF